MKDISPWNRNAMVSLIISLLAIFGASWCGAAPVSDDLVVLVKSPVSVQRGHTTTLPCWINPPQNAEGLEVRWYRGDDHFDSPIMLYREKKSASQEASYVGRVSFGLKDAASAGLTTGDVSLKLENATLEDAGDYTCYVSSDKAYESASVSLTVRETGSPLFLSAAWKEDNTVNVSCESEGWYPQPVLRWSDQKGALSTKNLKYSKDSSGLLSVHSWLLISSPSEVSCSVGLSGEEAKEARVRLDNPESGSSVAGWVAFAILLIATTLAGLAVLWFKKRAKTTKSESDHAEEKQELLPKVIKEVIQATDLQEAKKHYENVTLENTTNQYLTIRGCMLRDAEGKLPKGTEVSCLTAIKGTPGFSSGQHYWEVSMKPTKIKDPKESWWVGVTSKTDLSKEPGFIPTPSDGFWFLYSSPGKGVAFQFSSRVEQLLPVCSMPRTVGVYLNYDTGELSFYDVEKESIIASVKATFEGEKVFPLFNPGVGDKAPMEILHESAEQGQSSDMGNSVDSTAQETGS